MIGDKDEDYKLHKSNIKCPKETICRAVESITSISANDRVLIEGFIQQTILNVNKINIHVPIDILRLIETYCMRELIHWFERRWNASHFAIYLDDIIASLSL